MLRRQKLWDACQGPLVEKSTEKEKEAHTDAADLLTPLLTDRAKNRFTEEEFDDGYLMLLKIRSLFLPESDAAFMRYSRELYSLTLQECHNVDDWITKIKTLGERIDATKIKLTPEKRTLLVIIMGLFGHASYGYLAPILTSIPDLTVEKAIHIIKEDQLRTSLQDGISYNTYGTVVLARKKQECRKCGKTNHKEADCWKNITCGICKKKGHPTERCRQADGGEEEQPPQPRRPFGQGARALAVLAHTVRASAKTLNV